MRTLSLLLVALAFSVFAVGCGEPGAKSGGAAPAPGPESDVTTPATETPEAEAPAAEAPATEAPAAEAPATEAPAAEAPATEAPAPEAPAAPAAPQE